MPLLSDYARKKKIEYFIQTIPKDAVVLEVGCAEGWLGKYMKDNGWKNYLGWDIAEPADIVGDIRKWRQLGIKEYSFDVIVAFELVEHVNCFKEFFDMLKVGGVLMLTSPLPHMDFACKCLEVVGLNQKRTSRHDHLIYFDKIPFFEPLEIRTVGFMSQWGRFRKPDVPDADKSIRITIPPFEQW